MFTRLQLERKDETGWKAITGNLTVEQAAEEWAGVENAEIRAYEYRLMFYSCEQLSENEPTNKLQLNYAPQKVVGLGYYLPEK